MIGILLNVSFNVLTSTMKAHQTRWAFLVITPSNQLGVIC